MKTVLDIHGLSKNFGQTSYSSGSSSNDKRGRCLWTYRKERSWEDHLNKIIAQLLFADKGTVSLFPAKTENGVDQGSISVGSVIRIT